MGKVRQLSALLGFLPRIIFQHGEYGFSETMERTLVKSENMGTTFIQNPKMGGATVRSEGQKLMAFL